MAEAATTTSDSPRNELELEQRRLAKLWDAFKKQEDEYQAALREREELWTRVQELEKAAGTLGDPTTLQTRLDELERENERLRSEVDHLEAEAGDHRSLFQAEQRRLAKLFALYEDAQARLSQAGRAHAKLEQRVKKVLSDKQLAQRRYAAQMRVLRERARKARGGKGPIAQRRAARKLRRKLGIGSKPAAPRVA